MSEKVKLVCKTNVIGKMRWEDVTLAWLVPWQEYEGVVLDISIWEGSTEKTYQVLRLDDWIQFLLEHFE